MWVRHFDELAAGKAIVAKGCNDFPKSSIFAPFSIISEKCSFIASIDFFGRYDILKIANNGCGWLPENRDAQEKTKKIQGGNQMGFETNAAIRNSNYGVHKYDRNKNKYVFHELGKAVILKEIFESIEDESVIWKLGFDYLGKQKLKYIHREEFCDPQFIKMLGAIGADVPRKNMDIVIDTLRQQEEDMERNGIHPTSSYAFLGWIRVPFVDDTGATKFTMLFRAHELIGSHTKAMYVGPYDVKPHGEFATWQQLIKEDVVPYPVLQLVLIAALASVVLGLLAFATPVENPIVHLNCPSGTGKSTAGFLAASVIGCPFDGTKPILNEDGQMIELQSLYRSWGATDNAMIATQAGNRGAVTVLNELGKSLTKNMTRLIFDLSEGTDKVRLTTTLESRVSKGYSTAFISTGESSLLEKCNSKLEGLRIRVMEISETITKDAAHANRIKEICSSNYGFAVPLLVKYIIDKGDIGFVLPLYKAWVKELRDTMPPSPNGDRFVEKFAALFMTTADIAVEALGIDFDKEGLLEFLIEYDKKIGPSRNTSAKSYDLIIEMCRVNANKFFVRNDKSVTNGRTWSETSSVPSQDCWGRITNMAVPCEDDRFIVQEFEVRPSVLEKILRDGGFENKATCITEWKKLGVLDFEDAGHATRSRKIDASAPKGSKEDVYVFRVFADKGAAEELKKEIAARQEAEKKRLQMKKHQHNRISNFLDREEDGDDIAHTA